MSGYTEEVPEVALDHNDLVLVKPVRIDVLEDLVKLTGELVEKRAAIRELAGGQNQR